MLASGLLGLDPPETGVADLIRLAALFDINENRARVALSRMVTAGEASNDGNGRYRLTGPLLQRQARQQVSLKGAVTPWDGAWTTIVLTEASTDGVARTKRRRALRESRLAELREGVWIRPDNVGVDLPDWFPPGIRRIEGTIDGDPAVLVGELWNLPRWSSEARDLLGRLDAMEPVDSSVLAPGFVLAASVLRHLQADPLLPSELLPDDWPGSELRAVYDEWDRRYRRQLSAWYRSVSEDES